MSSNWNLKSLEDYKEHLATSLSSWKMWTFQFLDGKSEKQKKKFMFECVRGKWKSGPSVYNFCQFFRSAKEMRIGHATWSSKIFMCAVYEFEFSAWIFGICILLDFDENSWVCFDLWNIGMLMHVKKICPKHKQLLGLETQSRGVSSMTFLFIPQHIWHKENIVRPLQGKARDLIKAHQFRAELEKSLISPSKFGAGLGQRSQGPAHGQGYPKARIINQRGNSTMTIIHLDMGITTKLQIPGVPAI